MLRSTLTLKDLSQPSTSPRYPASPGLVLLIVCAGVVVASLDLFIVNVALPRVGADLHATGGGLAGLSWVLNGYAITYAALLVVFGRIAERYRRERAFLLGIGIFTAASAACGLATSLPMLIAFRAVQGAGAALLTPTSLGLVLASFPPERRAGAVRTWTATGGVAAAAGPVIGGLLVAASWRWVFLVNVPVGAAALVFGWRLLPRVEGHPVEAPDLFGAALVTGGVGLLTLGLVDGGSWGWTGAATLTALGGGAAALVAFAAHTGWHPRPLIERGLFRMRTFTGANATALVFNVAFSAMLLSRVLWAQDVWHWSPLETGLAIAPGPAMVPVIAFLVTGRLAARFGAAAVIAAGAAVFAGGAAWWALAIELRADYVGQMLGGIILTGIGVGLTLPSMMATGAASLPPASFATGSAVINMVRQIGLAIGVAALIAVLGAPRGAAEALVAYQHATWAIAAVALLSAAVALITLGPLARPPSVVPETRLPAAAR